MGRGFVYSYTVVERPLPPGFDSPYTVVLVEVDEGVRYLGLYVGDMDASKLIGSRVRARLNPDQRMPVSFAPEGG